MERTPTEAIRQDTREATGATRKDRIYCLKVSSDYHSEVCEECRFYPNCDHMTQDDMTELTIKDLEALEQQEPCEDCISREAVLIEIDKYMCGVPFDEKGIDVVLRELPPVTPTRKKGKWIDKSQKSGCGITFIASECTCCGKKTLFNCNELIYRYCPNCGAEMESKNEYNRQND